MAFIFAVLDLQFPFVYEYVSWVGRCHKWIYFFSSSCFFVSALSTAVVGVSQSPTNNRHGCCPTFPCAASGSRLTKNPPMRTNSSECCFDCVVAKNRVLGFSVSPRVSTSSPHPLPLLSSPLCSLSRSAALPYHPRQQGVDRAVRVRAGGVPGEESLDPTGT